MRGLPNYRPIREESEFAQAGSRASRRIYFFKTILTFSLTIFLNYDSIKLQIEEVMLMSRKKKKLSKTDKVMMTAIIIELIRLLKELF